MSDTESSDESVYLSAEEEFRDELDSASLENRNVPTEADDGGQESESTLPRPEEASNQEDLKNPDGSAIEDPDINTPDTSDTKEAELLNDSRSTDSSTDPSMKRPEETFTETPVAASTAATPSKDSTLYTPGKNGCREKNRRIIQGACQTAIERNEIRHYNGIPRPKVPVTLISSFRSSSAARATSKNPFDHKANGKTSTVGVKKQLTTQLSPVLSEGSEPDAKKDDNALPATDDIPPIDISPEKAWTFSALAPEFIPIRK
ncbi:MAG: hypothetical protein Q9191_005217 [Dirinaria sp. TL-2023a]